MKVKGIGQNAHLPIRYPSNTSAKVNPMSLPNAKSTKSVVCRNFLESGARAGKKINVMGDSVICIVFCAPAQSFVQSWAAKSSSSWFLPPCCRLLQSGALGRELRLQRGRKPVLQAP